MSKPLKQRLVEGFGIVFMLAVVGVAGTGLFGAFYWDPRHRPLVVVPPPGGGEVTVDGASVCHAAPWTTEGALHPCSITLAVGTHAVAIKSGEGGVVIQHADVTTTQGATTFLYAPELPPGKCLALVTYAYAEVVIPTLGSSSPQKPVALGFTDLGEVDYLFVEPPKRIESSEKDATRTAVRVVDCAPVP